MARFSRRGNPGNTKSGDIVNLYNRYAIKLWIYGAEMDPEAVTQALGIQPTDAFTTHNGPNQKVLSATVGAWIFRIEADEPEADPNYLIERLWEVFAPRAKVLHGLARKFDCEINMSEFFRMSHGGFSITPQTLDLLRDLGLPLMFTSYPCVGEEVEPDADPTHHDSTLDEE
jgi:hypothetical protein